MAELILRNQSRLSILAILDYIDDEEFLNRSAIQLNNRLSHLREQWEIFITNNTVLRTQAASLDEDADHAERYTSLEPLYLEAKSALEARITELYDQEPAHAQPQQQVPIQPQQFVIKVDQPKRDIENTWGDFNGNYLKWRGFCDLFTDRVHNDESLAPVQKFRLLRSSLKGAAAAALGEWELSDDNYIEAWNRLKELYEQTYLTGKRLVHRLESVNKLDKATGKGLQYLSNTGNDVFRQLRALKFPIDNAGFMIMFILHDRLDDDTSAKWNLERKSEYPTAI